MTPISLNRQLLATALLLLAAIALFQVSNMDFMIQDYFYDSRSMSWMVSRDERVAELIFYSGIKKLLILTGAGVLLILLSTLRFPRFNAYRQGMVILLLSAVLVPGAVGALKALSNTPCPKNLERYGGDYPDVKVLDAYPEDFHQPCRIRCWPAGHASGGFALMALFFLFSARRNRVAGVLLGLLLGWGMGTYKMLIGDHFFSHTLITMLIAWLLILLVVKGMETWKVLRTPQGVPERD